MTASHRQFILLLTLLPGAANTSFTAQQRSWLDITRPAPASAGKGMAYDAARDEVVPFDGNATWIRDGAQWAQRTTFGPPDRLDHAVAYDATRQRVVLFGGRTPGGEVLDDLWEWDGNGWTSVAAGPRPGARHGHAMTFDARRRVLQPGDRTRSRCQPARPRAVERRRGDHRRAVTAAPATSGTRST